MSLATDSCRAGGTNVSPRKCNENPNEAREPMFDVVQPLRTVAFQDELKRGERELGDKLPVLMLDPLPNRGPLFQSVLRVVRTRLFSMKFVHLRQDLGEGSIFVVVVQGDRIQIRLAVGIAISDMDDGIHQGIHAELRERPENHVAESLGKLLPFSQRKGSARQLHLSTPFRCDVEQGRCIGL